VVDRTGLADFLRRRREALRPVDVGLLAGPRRRVSGLRREEVAELAGMSADYYSRIEQRRGPQPSEQIVAAIARALRLDADERDHLLRLAGHRAPTRVMRSEHVARGLMRILDRLDDTPAMVVSDLAETLAQNRLATALLGDQTRYAGHARSAFHRWFTDPGERALYPERDHDHQDRIQAAGLRAALSAEGGPDPRAAAIVADLLARSPAFAQVWQRHEVSVPARERLGLADAAKTLVHPELGEVPLDCQVLHTDNRAQSLLVFTAVPGSEGEEKLALLSVLGHQLGRGLRGQPGRTRRTCLLRAPPRSKARCPSAIWPSGRVLATTGRSAPASTSCATWSSTSVRGFALKVRIRPAPWTLERAMASRAGPEIATVTMRPDRPRRRRQPGSRVPTRSSTASKGPTCRLDVGGSEAQRHLGADQRTSRS